MNQTQTAVRGPDGKFDNEEIEIVDLMIALAKRKRLIFGMPFAAALLAAAVTLTLPDVYKGTTKLVPPQQGQSSAAALLSQLGGMGDLAGAGGLKTPNDLYIGMLKSRTVADRLIIKFDLKREYGTESAEKARKILEGNTNIVAGKDGLIAIEVKAENKKLVARLANAYVDELRNLMKVLAVTDASQRRVFFEQQLEQAKSNLAAAEAQLKTALDAGGVISVDSDSRAIVETVGRVRAQISAKEIQLSSMRAFVTENNNDYRRVQEELGGLRAELSKLENGRANPALGAENKAGLKNIRVLREVKYQQMLYELLAKQYEAARLDEAKNPSLIQVLDAAVEPERKSEPNRSLIVLVAAGVAFLLATTLVFVLDAKQRALRLPAGAAKWAELKRSLRLRK